MVVMCLVYELVCCVSLCMCVSAVAAVNMVFHCDPIFGSVCHGPGWYSLFGSSNLILVIWNAVLSLICTVML